jgi:hypothetical protein
MVSSRNVSRPRTVLETAEPEIDEIAEKIETGEKPQPEMLDILGELGITPGDDSYSFTVCQVYGAARNGVREPQILEGDASILEGLQERLRKSFKEGRFRVRIFRNKRLVMRRDIEIATVPGLEPPAVPPSDMSAVLGAIEKQNERMLALFERMQERAASIVPAATLQIDPFAMFEKCVTIVSGLKSEVPSNSITHIMEAFNKGIELSKNIQGGGEAGWVDLVKSAIESPALAEIIASAAEARRPQQRRQSGANGARVVQPAPQPSPQVAQAPPQSGNGAQVPANYAAQLNAMLMERLSYLTAKAQANAAPELYAEWCLDNVPPDLAGMIVAPGFLDQVSEQLPQVKANREWFAALIAAMSDFMQGEAPAENSEGGTGDIIDPADAAAQHQ